MDKYEDTELLSLVNGVDTYVELRERGLSHKQWSALVAYREAHGQFNTVDDLLKVEGIGRSTLDNLRLYNISDTSTYTRDQSSDSNADSKAEAVDFTRKQAVWTAIIGYLVLYSPLYFLGRINHGWFIGCAVVGSILGVLALLAALGSYLSGQKRTAIAVTIMAFGIAVALGTASDDLQNSDTKPSSITGQHAASNMSTGATPKEETHRTLPLSSEASIRSLLSDTISALLWGTITSVNVKTEQAGQFLVVVKWDVAPNLAIDKWQFEYINLMINWAESIFTKNAFAKVSALRSTMSTHSTNIYGKDILRTVIDSTLYRDKTKEVEDWHRFKVNASLNPSAFFTEVAEGVYNVAP
jgi:competence ComEA-like helix-hairpin-helix protein